MLVVEKEVKSILMSWQDIGVENFHAGCSLVSDNQYHSAVSRFYYAAFSVLTHALEGKFATEDGQETPSHKGLRKLIKNELNTVSILARREIATLMGRLYAARIDADYRHRTTDRLTAQDARRDVTVLFEALGVKYAKPS